MSDNENVLVRREAGTVSVTDAGLSAIEKLAANGNADATIASALGINRKTFAAMLRENDGDERVLEAYYLGKARLSNELTDILLTHARSGNVTAAIYLSKARLGWRDQGPATPAVGSAVQVNITIPPAMSDEAFKKLVEAREVTREDVR